MLINLRAYSFLFIVVSAFTVANCEQRKNGDTGEIIKFLLDKHDSLVPPAYNVSVGLLLHLTRLQKLDIKNQVLTMGIHLEAHWMDPSLTWNSTFNAHPNGMKHIALPSAKIWTPKLFLANSVLEHLSQGTLFGEEVLINSDGHVTWHIYTIVQSSCTIDVTYYPFDQQTCILKFASQNPTTQVSLWTHRNYAMLDEFYLPVEYYIIEVPAYFNVYHGPEYNESDITYYVTLRRRTDWNSQVYPPLVLALLTLFPHLVLRSKVSAKLLLHMFSLSLIFVIWRDTAATIPSTTLVTPQIFGYLFPLVLLNSLHLLLTCLWSNCDQPTATNRSTQSIWNRIRSCACCQHDYLPENDQELMDPDRKKTKLQTNKILCWIPALFSLLMIIGLIFITANFLLSAPHMFEHVDATKILEIYN